MAELDDRFVKRGYWVDWSKGQIMGQTYTVEAQTGTILVALLTILASISTAQLWNLATFTIHQMRAHGNAAEGMYWQQQMLLRTMPTPTAFLTDYIKISWAWRSKVPHSFLRSLPMLVFGLLFAIGSIAAGISTSYAVDNSNIEVLVDSPHCGRLNHTKVVMASDSGTPIFTALGDSIQSYAVNCYQNSSSLPAICRNTFHRPNITFSAEPAPCPWNDTMCTGEGSSAVTMDSGVVDLRKHFGLNVAEKDSVRIRRKTTCNVLPREGHVFKRPPEFLKARGNPAERYTLEYGSWKGVPAAKRPEVTFNINAVLVEHQMSYFTTAMMAYANDSPIDGVIDALPEMNRTDADVALIPVWTNAVVYHSPVSDPLFAAHRLEMRQTGAGKDNALYWSDHYAGVIGCALQYQFCYPRPGKPDFCTPLGASPLPDTPSSIYPDASPIQASLLTLLQSIARTADITISPQLGNLRASKLLQVGLSPGLPDTQWITELSTWESFVWSSYQFILSTSVIGASVFDPSGADYTDAVSSTGDKQLCSSLRMRKAGGFANVNVFALSFLVTFSVLISVVSGGVLRFCIFMSRWRRALAPRIERWVGDGLFQVQRKAFCAQGEGRWEGGDKEIPVTEGRERLSELVFEGRQVREQKSFGSLETEGGEKGMKASREEEAVEWRRFRVSVGRVDTSATLVDGDVEKVKGKKGEEVGKSKEW